MEEVFKRIAGFMGMKVFEFMGSSELLVIVKSPSGRGDLLPWLVAFRY